MVDTNKIHVGDKVRCLIKLDCIKVGDIAEVIGIFKTRIAIRHNGTKIDLKLEDVEPADAEPETRGIAASFSRHDQPPQACTSTIEGTMTARFKSQSVTVRDVVNSLAKLPDRAYVHDIEYSMFDHKEDGPITVMTIRYRIDDKALPIMQYRGGPLRAEEMIGGTVPCEIINKQGT